MSGDRLMDPAENLPPDDIDQQIRINELRESAREAAGGEMTEWVDSDAPPGIEEQFWRGVHEYESAPLTSCFHQLLERGIDLPSPEQLDDESLTSKLWQVIEGLAKLQTFLERTDHLSDRELYALLWEDLLREAKPDFPPDSGWRHSIDILGGCSEEDMYLDRKYYADEEQRAQWAKDWPEDEMPDHVDPPYDRDSRLPKAEY